MAKFAPVAPIQILEEMKEQHCLGGYHLLLTHHILEYPERFQALFSDSAHSYNIIVDNSVVELGDAASDEKVLEACNIIKNVSGAKHWLYPVLTDVMGDGPATRKASTDSYEWWHTHDSAHSPMVVLQGNDWWDFCKTADYFLTGNFPSLQTVGIPRILTQLIGSRYHAIQYVKALAPMANIHLLGFSNDVVDDIICCNHPDVMGIDSAVPLRYAYSLEEGDSPIWTPTAGIADRPEDWFERGGFTDIDRQNLEHAIKWCA